MNICYPALILTSIIHMPLESMLKSGLFSVVATFLITLLLFFLSKYLFRHQPDNRQAQLRFQLGVGNVIYVSIPLLGAILGPEFFFVAIMHAVSQDILIWTLYYPMSLRSSVQSNESSWLKHLISPCLLALAAAILIKISGLTLPVFLDNTIARISSLTGPLALLYLGILIKKYGLWRWIKDRQALLYALVKTLAVPLGVLILLLPWRNQGAAPFYLALLFGSPAPIMSIIWADDHGGDVAFAINCCVSSTLFGIVLGAVAAFLLIGNQLV